MYYYHALKSQEHQIQCLLHCTSARPEPNFTRRDFTQVFQDKTKKDLFIEVFTGAEVAAVAVVVGISFSYNNKITLFYGEWWDLRQLRNRGRKKEVCELCILTLTMHSLNGFCDFKIRPAFRQACVAINPLQSMELWSLQQLEP